MARTKCKECGKLCFIKKAAFKPLGLRVSEGPRHAVGLPTNERKL